MTTSGFSDSSSLSHRLNTMNDAGAVKSAVLLTSSLTISGDFLYLSPSSLPGIPQERKYSKSGIISLVKPRYLFPPAQPTESTLKHNVFPFLTLASAAIMHRGSEPGLAGRARPAS